MKPWGHTALSGGLCHLLGAEHVLTRIPGLRPPAFLPRATCTLGPCRQASECHTDCPVPLAPPLLGLGDMNPSHAALAAWPGSPLLTCFSGGPSRQPPPPPAVSSGVLARSVAHTLPPVPVLQAVSHPGYSSLCRAASGKVDSDRSSGKGRGGCSGPTLLELQKGRWAARTPSWLVLRGLRRRDVRCASASWWAPPLAALGSVLFCKYVHFLIC